MKGEFSEQRVEAMMKDISAIIHQLTWVTVPRGEADNVMRSTWAFLLKIHLDGAQSKLKARYYVKEDLQKEGVETCAPVVSWSTIQIILMTVLQEEWTICQVDYDNEFP